MKVARKYNFKVVTDDDKSWDMFGEMTKSWPEGYDEIEAYMLMEVSDAPYSVQLMNRVGETIHFTVQVIDNHAQVKSGYAGHGVLTRVTIPTWDANDDDPQTIDIKILPKHIEGF